MERFAQWFLGIRAAVSFLISEGHLYAGDYPLGYMIVETEIARERVNGNIKTQAILFQSAMASTQSKKAVSAFKEQIEGL